MVAMKTSPRPRRCTGVAGPSAVLLVALMAFHYAMPSCFARPAAAKSAPVNKKPNRGMVHNKDKMPRHVLEIPLPEEEVEPEAKEEIPPYKPPYGIHVESHLADGHNPSVKYIQTKVMDALQSSEDFIHRVEVSLHEQEHFHRAKSSKRHASHSHEKKMDKLDQLDKDASPLKPGLLAPFQMKAVVQMRNHKQIIISNPEKHAQPTIPEAVDHLAEVLRKRVREEKEKEIRRNRKQKRSDPFGMEDDGADELEMIAQSQQALGSAARFLRPTEAAKQTAPKRRRSEAQKSQDEKKAPEQEEDMFSSFLGMFK